MKAGSDLHEYRITKYDPRLRDEKGMFKAEDWTSFKDIGREFGGIKLTEEEYERIEKAYVRTAVELLNQAGIESLTIRGLENSTGYKDPDLKIQEGREVWGQDIEKVIRDVLRETFWCRLEHPSGAFIHFGWDYYIYLGVPTPPSKLRLTVNDREIFVEPFPSPYKNRTKSQ